MRPGLVSRFSSALTASSISGTRWNSSISTGFGRAARRLRGAAWGAVR
jgi:hypothetical protein